MRKTLFLLVLLSPLAAYCNYGSQISGKWKEVSRYSPDNSRVYYYDTVYMTFSNGGDYSWQRQNGFVYPGKFTMTENHLDLQGWRYYNIVYHASNKLVLQDETGRYEFIPDYSSQINYLPPEPPSAPVSNINRMYGHWSKFKGTSPYIVDEIDYSHQLKMIDIYGSTDRPMGYLYATTDADNAPSWYVEGYDAYNQILYCDGRDRRAFRVTRCENNELRLEENGITYFFRQFNIMYDDNPQTTDNMQYQQPGYQYKQYDQQYRQNTQNQYYQNTQPQQYQYQYYQNRQSQQYYNQYQQPSQHEEYHYHQHTEYYR